MLNEVEVVSSASIGIAMSDPKHQTADDLLSAAAAANHQAKAQGRARWIVYEQAMRARALHLVQLEADLRHALTEQQFLVYFEPVVSLKTRRITGFEALVRWKHPARGLVSPGEFIPLAEETGLIVSIDRWVLFETARTVKKWHDSLGSEVPLTISVNLSGAELTQPDVVEQVAATLKTTGLDPSTLKMELTESSVVGNPGAAATVLQRLRDLGVHLSLDDFGTGYSSFQYVQQFPFDTVKIDRSFVKDVHVEKKSREIVGTITKLAHNLGMDVVAEGVDKADLLPHLQELGCDYAQGWLFAKPQDKEATLRFIESRPVW
jgi:EAL domain-containing protein (putative c-di-GMP-specific phosphodiesterase class I)